MFLPVVSPDIVNKLESVEGAGNLLEQLTLGSELAGNHRATA